MFALLVMGLPHPGALQDPPAVEAGPTASNNGDVTFLEVTMTTPETYGLGKRAALPSPRGDAADFQTLCTALLRAPLVPHN